MSISELLTGQNKTFLRTSVNTLSANEITGIKSVSTSGFFFCPFSTFSGSIHTLINGVNALTPAQLFSGIWLYEDGVPSVFTIVLPSRTSINEFLLENNLSLEPFVNRAMVVHLVNNNIGNGSVIGFNASDWSYGEGGTTIPVSADSKTYFIIRYIDSSGKWRID